MTNTAFYSIVDYKFFSFIKLHYLITLYFLICSSSIAVSQIILFICGIFWVIGILFYKNIFKFRRSSIDLWLISYIIISLIAIIFSFNFKISLSHLKQLSLFLIFFFGIQVLTDIKKVRFYINIFILGGIVNCFYALFRYIYFSEGGLEKRLHGFINSWMTFSGFMMIILLLLIAKLIWQRNLKYRGLYMLLVVIFFATILLTLTRSSWIGLFCGIIVLTYFHSRKLLISVIILAIISGIIAYPFLPKALSNRFRSIFDLNDTTNKERIYMMRIAINIIKKHPLLGLGPGMLQQELPEYVSEGIDKNWNIPHLHNNILQNAVDKGLVGLFAWLSMYIKWLFDSFAGFYRKEYKDIELAAGSIAAIIAFLVAGLFEYNFGDSEILMIILFIMAIPYTTKINHSPNLVEATNDIK